MNMLSRLLLPILEFFRSLFTKKTFGPLLVLAILFFLPLKFLLLFIHPQSQEFKLLNVSGFWWKGEAVLSHESAAADQRFSLLVSFRYCPISSLSFSGICLQINTDAPDAPVPPASVLRLKMRGLDLFRRDLLTGGPFVLSDIDLKLSAQDLSVFLSLSGQSVLQALSGFDEGFVSLSLKTLTLQKATPLFWEGSGRLEGLSGPVNLFALSGGVKFSASKDGKPQFSFILDPSQHLNLSLRAEFDQSRHLRGELQSQVVNPLLLKIPFFRLLGQPQVPFEFSY